MKQVAQCTHNVMQQQCQGLLVGECDVYFYYTTEHWCSILFKGLVPIAIIRRKKIPCMLQLGPILVHPVFIAVV